MHLYLDTWSELVSFGTTLVLSNLGREKVYLHQVSLAIASDPPNLGKSIIFIVRTIRYSYSV
jgi:hypothetical protein